MDPNQINYQNNNQFGLTGMSGMNGLMNTNQFAMSGMQGYNPNYNINMFSPGNMMSSMQMGGNMIPGEMTNLNNFNPNMSPNMNYMANMNNMNNMNNMMMSSFPQNFSPVPITNMNNLSNNILNTSQQNLNNSMPMLQTNFGLGLLGNNLGPQYAMDPYMANSYRMAPTNPQYFNQMASMLYPQQPQENINLSNYILEHFNQMNVEEFKKLQEQEEQERKERENAGIFKKNFEEELQKLLLEKTNIDFSKRVDIFLQKPEYFYERDRFFFEELIQQPLKTEGLLGMGLVKTIDKSILYNANNITSYQHANNIPDLEYFSKMNKDGVYLDYIKQLIYSYNLQKVEQRILREGKTDMFKQNGDLKLDNDIFSDVITKPLDISLTSNDKFSLQYLNSMMCSRAAERNFKNYKMKFFVSKIFFKSHPLFNEEDVLNSALRELYKDYYKLMNAIDIPFIKNKIITITRQMDEYSQIKEPSESIKKELNNMRMFVSQTVGLLENQKKLLNEKGNLLYNKWIELKSLRQRQKFNSTNLKLNVLRFPTKENTNLFDYAFVLSHIEPSNNDLVTKEETKRRNKIKKLRCYLRIYINDTFVAQSKTYQLQWPNFEVDINNLFNLNVYTRPTKIEVEIYVGKFTFKKVVRFEVPTPGVFMDSVTSTSTLQEEIDFESASSKENKNKIKQQLERSNTFNDMKVDEGDKLLPKNAENNLYKNNSTKVNPYDYTGRVYLKVEWEGNEPDMPPTRIEDKIALSQLRKNGNEKEFNKQADENVNEKLKYINKPFDYPFDVNDPKNVIFFDQMKKAKTELLLKYLNREYNLPFYDIPSLRHFLLNKRLQKYSLKNKKIPILENEIESNTEMKKMIKHFDEEKVETEEEYEQKIKTQLEKLNHMHAQKEVNDSDYLEILSNKIKTMKKDIINKIQMSYFQVVNEFIPNSDTMLVVRELCSAIFTPPRNLAPRKKRVVSVKVENTTEIKINIHVVKGYNVPVRHESIPASLREIIKAQAIGKVYRSSMGGLYNRGFSNQLNKRNATSNPNSFRNTQGFANRNNSQLNNQFNPYGTNNQFALNNQQPFMPQLNNINNINNLNNSNPFATPGMATGNHSLVGGINMNINPQNNLNEFYINHPNQAINSPSFNPNLNNVLFNPNGPSVYPMYNQPGIKPLNALTSFNNGNIPMGLTNYEGDILQMVDILKDLEQNIDSFVSVKMNYYDQEVEMRTDSIDGVHPDYNYKMQFTIKPKKGCQYFDRDQIAKCSGGFFFTLYDEFRSEEKITEKDANTYVYRYEKKYLGAFQIPFTTIFQNANLLETMCKINVPMTVFGYYSDSSSAFDVFQTKEEELRKSERGLTQNKNNNIFNPNAQAEINVNNPNNLNNLNPELVSKSTLKVVDDVARIVNPYINTYLSLYITMDPVPSFLKHEDVDYVPGFEDSVFLINTTKWLKNIKTNTYLSSRHIKLLAENFDGFSVFMPRYIRPGGQKPPEIIFDGINAPEDGYSIEKAARFVSLIPFIEDSQTFDNDDMPDCWCTDEQFLTLGFGDYEEHAILLCNYFNYIDAVQKNGKVKSYLVLGKAYPEGLTTYVLRKSLVSPDIEFWNAKTGECFYFDKRYHDNKFLCLTLNKTFNMTRASSDSICQLQEIGSIVSDENVYINIQQLVDPGLIDFDFENAANWTPFLNSSSRSKYFPNGITTVQKDLIYEQPNSEESYNLKNQIFNYLKNQIQISRSSLEDGKAIRTNWERTAHDKIENILCDYDGFYFTHKKSGVDDIKNEFIGVSQVYGFPINLSFTTLKQIWDEVKLTDVHLIADETSELSLSVFVNGYPAKVYSVWIFFAVIKK